MTYHSDTAPKTVPDLDALERILTAASPGPWRCGRHLGRTLYCDDGDGEVLGMLDRAEDTALAVAARSALPQLIAEVRGWRAAMGAETGPIFDAASAAKALIRAMGNWDLIPVAPNTGTTRRAEEGHAERALRAAYAAGLAAAQADKTGGT